MNPIKRVVITGSAGRVGRAAVRALVARGHHVIGYDRVPTPGLTAEDSLIAGISDSAILDKAVVGADCLIHLAATPDDAQFPRGTPPHDGDNFLSELVPNNVIGPYHIMEAARKAGVPRVVLASTGQLADGYLKKGQVPVTTSIPARPRYLYACTKVFLEALGQVYAEQHGMTVIAARLGWCPRDMGQVEEIKQSRLGQDVFFSPGDVGRFFTGTVEAERLPNYSILFATSLPTYQLRYDLEASKKLLGYVPQDRWPTGATEF